MGALLQKLLHRVLSPDSAAHPHHHVTATLGCCSTILIDEHEQENAPHNKDDENSDDASDLGGLARAHVGI